MTVHVALPSDQNYLHGLKVTAVSIVLYASNKTKLFFHILDGGIEDNAFAEFENQLSSIRQGIKVIRHRIDESLFNDCPVWNKNRMTYARLLLPELLDGVDHVIYSDTDVLWLSPIEELWNQVDDNIPALVIREFSKETKDKENLWFAENGMHVVGDDYFCAGVIVYNLRLFRNEDLAGQAFKFIQEHPGIHFADQTAMNQLLYKRVCIVERRWQTLSLELGPNDALFPVVVHYANEIPWRRAYRWELISDTVLIWHLFNDRFILGKRGSSLRSYFCRFDILYKRSLYLMLRYRWFKLLFELFMRMIRSVESFQGMEKYLKRLNQGEVNKMLDQWQRLGEGKTFFS